MTTGSTAAIGGAAIVAVAVAMSGCGGATQPVAQTAPSGAASPSPSPKQYAHGTGHLQMTVTPTRGSVGTEVSIRATGCGDPDGRNHAVSFNPGFGNTLQAAQAHYHQGVIASRLTGQTLTATYRITAEDVNAAAHADAQPSLFYVQCSDDLADATFLLRH